MYVDLCMLRVVGQPEQQQVSKRIIATLRPPQGVSQIQPLSSDTSSYFCSGLGLCAPYIQYVCTLYTVCVSIVICLLDFVCVPCGACLNIKVTSRYQD